ncbi:hypothetical protein GQ54DRAFT_325075 [Martensiomyces pterosporus]|nr:hypothetical protein GQ54DRAFT_325075 [Martensiomyces pterosporus]
MHYSPSLDAAPSSVSSSLVGLSSSFLSTVGSCYMLYRLRQVNRVYWQSRHYLILSLTGSNLVMSLVALISGFFFFVYGRIPSAVGCTIGGMLEFWSQQLTEEAVEWRGGGGASRVGVRKSKPVMITVPRYSAIDSGAVSHVTAADGRGLFSQSIHNIHQWALSMLGISNAGGNSPGGGLRAKAIGDPLACPEGPLYKTVDYYTIGLQHASMLQHQHQQQQGGDQNGNQDQPRPSITLGVAKASRNYYETFKRSIVSNFVRRFIISTDIPSPTIPSTIFDSIGNAYTSAGSSSSCLTHCEVRSSTESTADSQNATQNSHCPISPGINVAVSWDRDAGGPFSLKRWYSVLSRFVSRPGAPAAELCEPNQPQHKGSHKLRRTQTAPILSSGASLLSSSTMQPKPPLPVLQPKGKEVSPRVASNTHQSQQKTLVVPSSSTYNQRTVCDSASAQIQRSCSIKKRKAGVGEEETANQDSSALDNHRTTHHTSIHTYAPSISGNDGRVQQGVPSFSVYSDDSAQIVDIEAIEKWESLEDGRHYTGHPPADRRHRCRVLLDN